MQVSNPTYNSFVRGFHPKLETLYEVDSNDDFEETVHGAWPNASCSRYHTGVSTGTTSISNTLRRVESNNDGKIDRQSEHSSQADLHPTVEQEQDQYHHRSQDQNKQQQHQEQFQHITGASTRATTIDATSSPKFSFSQIFWNRFLISSPPFPSSSVASSSSSGSPPNFLAAIIKATTAIPTSMHPIIPGPTVATAADPAGKSNSKPGISDESQVADKKPLTPREDRARTYFTFPPLGRTRSSQAVPGSGLRPTVTFKPSSSPPSPSCFSSSSPLSPLFPSPPAPVYPSVTIITRFAHGAQRAQGAQNPNTGLSLPTRQTSLVMMPVSAVATASLTSTSVPAPSLPPSYISTSTTAPNYGSSGSNNVGGNSGNMVNGVTTRSTMSRNELSAAVSDRISEGRDLLEHYSRLHVGFEHEQKELTSKMMDLKYNRNMLEVEIRVLENEIRSHGRPHPLPSPLSIKFSSSSQSISSFSLPPLGPSKLSRFKRRGDVFLKAVGKLWSKPLVSKAWSGKGKTGDEEGNEAIGSCCSYNASLAAGMAGSAQSEAGAPDTSRMSRGVKSTAAVAVPPVLPRPHSHNPLARSNSLRTRTSTDLLSALLASPIFARPRLSSSSCNASSSRVDTATVAEMCHLCHQKFVLSEKCAQLKMVHQELDQVLQKIRWKNSQIRHLQRTFLEPVETSLAEDREEWERLW